MQTPHLRAGTYHYYPYAGGKRLSPKSLGIPATQPAEVALDAMKKRGDHLPDSPAKPVTLLERSDEWAKYKTAKNGKPADVVPARRVIEGCGFRTPADVTETKVVAYVRSLMGSRDKRKKGGRIAIGVRTANKHLKDIKAFFRWMQRQRIISEAENTLSSLESFADDGDVRRKRRVVTQAEMQAVLAAARNSKVAFRGLTGKDRYLLYLTAAYVGQRASLLWSLTPSNFHLDSPDPYIACSGTVAKNKKPFRCALADTYVAELRPYLAGRPADKPIWPGTWRKKAAKMMATLDLPAAGIAYQTDEGYFDFHSWRHLNRMEVGRAGADTKVGKSITGHLTDAMFNHYGTVSLADQAPIVNQMFRPLAPVTPAANHVNAPTVSLPELVKVFNDLQRQSMDTPIVIGDLTYIGPDKEWVFPKDPIVFGHVMHVGENDLSPVESGPAGPYDTAGVVNQFNHENGGENGTRKSTQGITGKRLEGVAQPVEQRTFNP